MPNTKIAPPQDLFLQIPDIKQNSLKNLKVLIKSILKTGETLAYAC